MSNTSLCDTGIASEIQYHQLSHFSCDPLPKTTNMIDNSTNQLAQSPMAKKKRNLPGNPDPNAEVIALSPKTLMATNRFVCDICHKGFQRDQNLQLHRRGHNLPWKLRQKVKNIETKKKVYVCPEASCVHHNPCRALGDLTGIKKHYSRKHGEKTWKCERCSKKYAVQSDWKAHSKICGSKEYKCDCGTIFSRRDSFMTHRAFCDALAQENKLNQSLMNANMVSPLHTLGQVQYSCTNTPTIAFENSNMRTIATDMPVPIDTTDEKFSSYDMNPTSCLYLNVQTSNEIEERNKVLAHLSPTALLNKAAQLNSCTNNWPIWSMMQRRTSVVGTVYGPYGPLKQLSGLNQVVGSINQRSGNDFYCNWMNDMCMYNGVDGIFTRHSEGLLGNNGVAMMAGGHDSECAMTVDFLGVEADGKLHANQQQQVLELGSE